MNKYPDKYFIEAPWQIIEEGFNPNYSMVCESVFSLGNEYMGLRGYFDEGYSGESLVGSYINGVYEREYLPKNGYRGMLEFSEFMVNSVNWVYTRVFYNDTQLDLATAKISDFKRVLDLKSGVLSRSFIWHINDDNHVKIEFKRLVSMVNNSLGGQQITFTALKGSPSLKIVSGLDFSQLHESREENFWVCSEGESQGSFSSIIGTTKNTKQNVFAAANITGAEITENIVDNDAKFTGVSMKVNLLEKESLTLSKLVAIVKQADESDFELKCKKEGELLSKLTFADLEEGNRAWWGKQWELSDIEIKGDPENQQGIRYCIFQLHQTLHSADHTAVIGAKGLTGEAYNGNTFWDTEVYCLPFYLFNNLSAAKNILQFRYETLEHAKERAHALDCNGAFYPIATISGRECCDLWQHASLQLQPSTAVMYGIWIYDKITKDKDFLHNGGAPMLVEIARMLATRGGYDPITNEYGFFGVMGPDEFQMMVNNNSYTNYIGKKAFEFTIKVLEDLKEEDQDSYNTLVKELDLKESEIADWAEKASSMKLIYDEDTKIYEQHEGYHHLPELDFSTIPTSEFPLYSGWSYDRIYRNKMIKQPDVLMFMLMFNADFTQEELEANYDYYGPRCIHESSLSPSVHSILASQLGRNDEAYDLFGFATRMDLDNYNRNTCEGLHTTSIAASWMNIVFGFGGLRIDADELSLAPRLPKKWDSYKFSLLIQGVKVSFNVGREVLTVTVDDSSKNISLNIYNQKVVLDKATTSIEVPSKWRI